MFTLPGLKCGWPRESLQHIQDALLQNVTGRSRRFDSAVKSEYTPGTLDCSQPAAAFLPQQPAAEQQCRRCSRYRGSNVDGPVSHPGPVTRILHPLAFADKSPPKKTRGSRNREGAALSSAWGALQLRGSATLRRVRENAIMREITLAGSH
jgi:hypothetical protein